jgi:uncharacterized membrane protein YhaH (DUF805 family)
MLEQYKNYLRDNPHNLWFKRKIYGWGWVPVRWQGWMVLLVFVAVPLLSILELGPLPTDGQLFWFFSKIIVAVIVLIWICYKKGERPRWQWGIPKK